MLLVMDENNDHSRQRGPSDRFRHQVRTDADEIDDWIHGSGQLVLGGVLVFIALFAIYGLVFA